jgi:NAD(P)H-dependent flavin oxidoreductase YrpB (nitropropane dioxygenase family)
MATLLTGEAASTNDAAPDGAPRLPRIIQGGMGIAVSNWRMARAVAQTGALGVVSGTAIDTVMVRRLQDGDPGGDVRRAMARFPLPEVVAHVTQRFFQPEGRAPNEKYKLLPLYKQAAPLLRQQITMLAAFVEVSLAREGHDGMVGMNLLAKIQMPTLPLLYGAMLAGVHVILMGAGIPREIPGALDAMAKHEPTSIKFDLLNAGSGPAEELAFDPRAAYPGVHAPLHRPLFFPIVAAASLAQMLARKANGRVDGFIVEGPTAGGHNAPPRGALKIDEHGEPIYGERDVVDLAAMREIGLPFWIAGGAGSPEGLEKALAAGAAGIQVGTLFAYSDESGFTPALRRQVIDAAIQHHVKVHTDVQASPTGYPFKVVATNGASAAPHRERECDLGYLREAVRREDGRIEYRCAAEPIQLYMSKGGAEADTAGRQCLCNALCACIGLAQPRGDGQEEQPIITSGDDVVHLADFLQGRTHYSAVDVIAYLTRAGVPAT